MHVSILGRHELAPPPTFAFGKIVPSGLKMGAEHSNIYKVIYNSMKYDIVQSRSGDYMGPLIGIFTHLKLCLADAIHNLKAPCSPQTYISYYFR